MTHLIAALQERFTESAVQIGYIIEKHAFSDAESFAQSIYTVLGTPEEDRDYLYQLLSGDVILFCICKV